MAAADYYPIVQELYMSYFGRPADPRGLENFAAKLDALGAPTDPTEMVAALVSPAGQNTALKTFINSSFSTSDESKALYTSNDNLLFVNQIYKNVLNRDGDREGLLYWTNKLDNHEVSRENAALAILEGALNNTTPQGIEDAKLVAVKVEIAQHFTDAIDTGPELTAYVGNAAAAAARNMLQTVTSSTTAAGFQATVEATLTGLVEGTNAGQSFDLKTGLDTLNGTNGNDTFNAILGDASTTAKTPTLTGLDNINGGLGSKDTLNISDLSGGATMPGGITLTSIEMINVSSVGAVGTGGTAFDVSGLSGVTSLNVAMSKGADFIKAGSAQAVTVADSAGFVTVTGGSTQTVTTAGGVALSKAAGAVTVTDSAQGVANSTVDGGTDVSITSTADVLKTQTGTTGKITVGNTTAASGNVTITTNLSGDATGDSTAGAIYVKGGKVVTVTQNATQDLDSDGSANTLNQAAVTVDGNASTTTVNVKQAMAAAADDAVDAVAEVAEVATVKFSALKVNESVTIDGLTFTAAKALTAAQAAAAFANLVKGATQGTAPTANGLYTGTYGGNWASGAAASDTVTFTNTAGGAVADLTTAIGVGGTNTATVTTTVPGVDEVEGVEGTGGITAGVVTITDKNYGGTSANTIATVSLDSYGAGSAISSSALTSLSIANAVDSSLAVSNKTATTLSLTVNDVFSDAGTSTLNLDAGGATYTALNVHTAGEDSDVNVTAAAVTALKVDGEAAIDLTGSTFTALKTVAISGAAGVTADFSGANVTDVNASATSGKVTTTINASKATYEGGSGTDTVTLSSTTVSKAISLGAGNDTINLAAGTTALGAKIDGGEGTDILGLAAADAASVSANNVFAGNFTGFEKVKIGQSTGANSVNLANLNNISYVISAGTGASAVPAATPLVIVETEGVAATTTEKDVITFSALSAGQFYTVAGRTVTATGAASAAEVTAAMATGANSANVTVTGVLTGWTVTNTAGNDVTFTSTTATTDVADITTAATVAGTGSLTLTNMADAGTLELTAAGSGATVTMKDATGTADTFNIVTKGNASTNYGTVAVAGVETVNVNVNDTKTSDGIMTATLTVKDAAAKSVVITGNANLNLTLDATDVAVTSIDGSAATGKLTIATLAGATAAATVKGGAAADMLTANHISDVLNGGAGNDTLIVNADLVSLTGGAGKDVFDVSHATTNVNAYATIADLGSGDMIKFAGSAATFNASKVALGDTAVFQDYANAAINQSDTGNITWFQFGGATYVVENVSNATTFVNGSDVIVKITGTVDLSTASFNSSTDTLLIA